MPEGLESPFQLSFPDSLTEWEERFAPLVRSPQLRLLGELAVSDDEHQKLALLIGARYRALRKRKALIAFRHECPCAFAMFMVLQGIYGYEHGNYWTDVAEAAQIKLDAVEHSDWGRVFEEVLVELGKPLFEDIQGNRYLKVILAHGGIPNYSLPDFFKLLLQPAVTRPQYADLDIPELIDELLQRSAVNFADKPVRRFLQHGGLVAQNFFDRCREMAQDYLDSGIVPEASEVGLPPRVVSTYREWAASVESLERRVFRSDDLRLRKPLLGFDPWGSGIALRLPAQHIPVTLSRSKFSWSVQVEAGEPRTIHVRLRRTGFDLRTIEVTPALRLEQPAARYVVQFQVDGNSRRTWHFDGVAEENPALFFDAASGERLPAPISLPARRLWAVYPVDGQITWEGICAAVDLPSLYDAWATFRAQEIDLTQTSRLELLRTGQRVGSWPVRPDESQLRPYLADGLPCPVPQPSRYTPLYFGTPPVVRIPVSQGQSPSEELKGWRIALRSQDVAMPDIRLAGRLAEFVSSANSAGLPPEHLDIHLALPTLLGPAPAGTFDIRLRGPLGRDSDLPLRIWQGIELRSIPALCLPDPVSGPQPVYVEVITARMDDIACEPDDGEVDSEQSIAGDTQRLVRLRARSEAVVLHLTLSRTVSGHDIVRVPLEIPIPRVRWLLMDDKAAAGAVLDWSALSLRTSLDALLQMGRPILLVSLPASRQSQIDVQLRLRDIDQVCQLSPWKTQQSDQQQWFFSLAEFLDTIQASHSPVLRFELNIRGVPEHNHDDIMLPVLGVTQTLLIEHPAVQLENQDGHYLLHLTWDEPSAGQVLKHRHVRLWHVWQPWRPPIEHAIPDEAAGELLLPITPSDLSARLRLQFSVEDPWITSVATRLMPSGDGQDATLIPAPQRLKQLQAEAEGHPEARFAALLEIASIWVGIGNGDAARHPVAWCIDHLNDATIEQAASLHSLASSTADGALVQRLVEALFAPEQLARLVLVRSQGAITQAVYEDYLSRLPSINALTLELCRQLIEVDMLPTIQWDAMQRLVQEADPAGVAAVLDRVKRGQLSDTDALAILTCNGEFAAEQLERHVDDEIAVRLLMKLSTRLGSRASVVTAGTWVHTDAGWGRIEGIIDPATGAVVDRFFHQERTYHLRVTLRPTVGAVTILLKLPEGQIQFLEANRLFICGKCHGCVALTQNEITSHHHRAAHANTDETIYSGIGAIVAPVSGTTLDLTEKQLRFSHHPVGSEWN